MAKRFTDTDKWKKAWFNELSVTAKLVWYCLLDNCDHSGVWSADFSLLSFYIKQPISEHELTSWFRDKIEKIDHDKYFIRSFIDFQYGQLRDQSAPHKSVITSLKKHGIEIDYKTGFAQTHGAIQKRLSNKFKEQVLIGDKFICTYCGAFGDETTLVVDHIVPKYHGGDNSCMNLTTSCISCNSSKTDRPVGVFISSMGDRAKISSRLSEKLNTLFNPLNNPINKLNTLKDKEEDKEKDMDKDKEEEKEKDSEGSRSFKSVLQMIERNRQ